MIFRFKNLITSWRGVDVENSTCFQNKKNSSWNGWAIVYFISEIDRQNFLEDENQHFVRDPSGAYHKLKVTKWFQKQVSVPQKSVSSARPLPLYKADLFFDRETSQEEFERSCNESSIQSFRGTIHSYITNTTGLGHNGFIEIKLSTQVREVSEYVLFNSDSVWLCFCPAGCFGGRDCLRKSGKDDNLPLKLKVGSEVVFTGRKIPQGLVESCRFQAKSVWQGDGNQPNYISPPSSFKLDEYLEDYLTETNSPSPNVSSPAPSLENQGGSSSPVFNVVRQKPLQGSLKQLNSSLDKNISIKVQKKIAPSNFAQAVAAVSVVQVEETADFVEKGKVESFPNSEEIVVSIHGYGRFTLDQRHFEGSFQDVRSNLKLDANLAIALSNDKRSGKKGKFVVIRAFPDIDPAKATKENYNDDFHGPASGDSNDSGHSRGESNHEINLEDLDKYYDTYSEIYDYLHREILVILPNLPSKSIECLTNDIIYNVEESCETKILQEFFKSYGVNVSTGNKFIGEFIKFRRSFQFAEDGLLDDITPETPVFESFTPKPLPSEVEHQVSNFLKWISTQQVRSTQTEKLKLEFYNEMFRFPESAIFWFNSMLKCSEQNIGSILYKFPTLQSWVLKRGGDCKSILSGLESDSAQFLALTECKVVELEEEKSKPESQKFAGLILSTLESEFVACKEKEKETNSFILRVLTILRKAGIKLEDLLSMHRDHLRLSTKPRNREFNSKMQSFLMKKTNQSLLEETNIFIGNNKDLKVKQYTPVSCKKIEKFVPILTTCLCGFIFERANIPLRNGSASPQRNIPTNSEPKDEFAELVSYMEKTKYSNFINGVRLTLINKKISLMKLESIYMSCNVGGIMKWNLELSKLQLNPPVGISVIMLSEILWNFCSSRGSTDDQEYPRNMEKTNDDLKIPSNLLTVYNSSEVIAIMKRFKDGELENAFQEGYDVISSLDMYWRDKEDESEEMFAFLAAVIWEDCKVDKLHLENTITKFYQKHAYDEKVVEHLQNLLTSWASILDSSSTFKTCILSVYNILKVTLASFDPNTYEDIQDPTPSCISQRTFMNLTLGDKLYSGEGIVIGNLGDFFIIQTKFCKVLAHQAVSFGSSSCSINYDLDPDILRPFDQVRVHSVPVSGYGEKDTSCHVALMAWQNVVDEAGAWLSEPPHSGVLLPFSHEFYERIKKKAQELVESEPSSGFSEFGLENQLLEYDNLLLSEKRFDGSWVETLDQIKIYWVLCRKGFITQDTFEKKVFSELEKYDVFVYDPDCSSRLDKYLARDRKAKEMLSFSDFKTNTAPEMFLEKYPSKWFKFDYSKRVAGEVADSMKLNENKSNRRFEYEGSETRKPEVPSIKVVDESLSSSEYRLLTEQKLDRLNTAVETLLQVLQETTATINSLDKRVETLEKVGLFCID